MVGSSAAQLSGHPLGGVSEMWRLFAAVLAGAVVVASPANPVLANEDEAVAELRTFISCP